MAQPVDPIEAEGLQPPVTQHARDLGVLWRRGTVQADVVRCALPWGRAGACRLAPCPSSLKVSSRFMSPSALPRRRFLPPLPLFFTMLACYAASQSSATVSERGPRSDKQRRAALARGRLEMLLVGSRPRPEGASCIHVHGYVLPSLPALPSFCREASYPSLIIRDDEKRPHEMMKSGPSIIIRDDEKRSQVDETWTQHQHV